MGLIEPAERICQPPTPPRPVSLGERAADDSKELASRSISIGKLATGINRNSRGRKVVGLATRKCA
jgi:hypothetical protein